MQNLIRAGAVAAVSLWAALTFAGPANATGAHSASNGAVFVQTDDPAGNDVIAYTRNHDGTLTQAGSTGTSGRGGQLTGSVVDHTASQGALAADAQHHELYAVNAGSNSLSVLGVHGASTRLQQVINTRGNFPVSAPRTGTSFTFCTPATAARSRAT
ncbi:MAG: hypothetical protein ACR2KJ_04770 [Jatrophihabitans sp.]